MSTESKDIQIMGEPTMDPQVCKFLVDRPLCPEGAVNCTSAEMARGSTLMEELFAIDGVKEVLAFGNQLTIVKENDEEWPVLGQKIGAAIRMAINSGEPLIGDQLKQRKPADTELRNRVQALLQREINPYVSSHGGFIEVVDARDAAVYVNMSGGCQGCASAQMTLRQGVEQLIFRELPEVRQVVDVTDHAAGTNPYHQ